MPEESPHCSLQPAAHLDLSQRPASLALLVTPSPGQEKVPCINRIPSPHTHINLDGTVRQYLVTPTKAAG